ncbi:hypothetical protein ACEQPO_06410 [Bacillus sp. SL00103]
MTKGIKQSFSSKNVLVFPSSAFSPIGKAFLLKINLLMKKKKRYTDERNHACHCDMPFIMHKVILTQEMPNFGPNKVADDIIVKTAREITSGKNGHKLDTTNKGPPFTN